VTVLHQDLLLDAVFLALVDVLFDAVFLDDVEEDFRFFAAPPPLSRALLIAIATACFCAFFRLAGWLVPIAPLLS
jgi:hypothetical protein